MNPLIPAVKIGIIINSARSLPNGCGQDLFFHVEDKLLSGRFNKVRIDLDALAHNLGQVRKLVGPAVKIMAVVKANAYGHGGVRAGLHLAYSGADAIGVMDLHEAVCLREAGIKLPIYVLAGMEPENCPEMAARDIIPFVYDAAGAREMNEAARRAGKKAAIHLKLDTGMSRLGVLYDRAGNFFKEVSELEYLTVTGLATHFPEADVEGSDFTDVQISRFSDLIDQARTSGLNDLTLNTACNSAGVLSHKAGYFDMVRPGLMLYGDYPDAFQKPLADLKPVMNVTSRVIQVKQVPAGSGVSYGRIFTTDRETILAAAPLGYAHGFNRLLSNQGHVLIRGKKAPLRGRVCMNLTMFDVTDIPGVSPGDEIVVMGASGDQSITGADIAARIGTISYEVFCIFGGLNTPEYI